MGANNIGQIIWSDSVGGGWELCKKIRFAAIYAQKSGEAVGPVGGETGVPRFLAVNRYR